MTGVKVAAAAAAMVAAGGLGAAFAPAASTAAQTVTVRQRPADRDVRIVTGRGGRIGVTISEVDTAAQQKAKLAGPGGVLIDEVEDESPAATAGFKAGDVVVEFDGERVRGARQFTRLVQETPAGRGVAAVVMRDGQRVTLTVTPRESGFQYFGGDLAEWVDGVRTWALPMPPEAPMPPEPAPPAPPAAPAPPSPPARLFEFDDLLGRLNGRLGIRISTLEPQLGEYFGVKEGVLVTSVDGESPAARAGVKAGDVVVSLNGRPVSSPSELRREAQRLGSNEDFTMDVVRDKQTTTLKGKTDEAPRRRTRTVL